MKILIPIISILLFVASCKKKSNDIIITGKVYSPNESTYLQGVKVSLKGQLFQNNTWNSNYQEIASVTTDASGQYRIEHENFRTNGLKLVSSKSQYITSEKNLNFEEIIPGEEFTANMTIYPQSFLLIKVKNTIPANDDDQITVHLDLPTQDCETCLQSGNILFEGADVNDTIAGIVYGKQDYTVKWTVNSNGQIQQYSQTVHSNINDTATVNITY